MARPEVRPVRRYRQPRYPSHLDPDPTREQPVYPFTPALISVVAATGLAGPFQQAFAADGPPAPSGNPFALANSGLPHHTSPYGTGAPDHLDSQVARALIRKLFAEAGYQLGQETAYERGEVRARLDGFDPQRKVGFVFGDWENLDDDAVLKWWTRNPGDRIDASALDPALRAEYDTAMATTDDAARERALGEVAVLHGMATNAAQDRWHGLGKDDVARANAARALADPAARASALRAIMADIAARRLTLVEARAIETRAASDREFIAVISTFDKRFEFFGWDLSEEARKKVEEIQDPERRAVEYRRLASEAAQKALDNLERAVRDYIAWARANGAP